jgi:hypothetical protein
MLHLHTIRPRIPRLRELVAELVQDVLIAKTAESPLLDGERRAYLIGIQEAIAGLHEARVVRGKAVQRIEELGLPDELT